MRTRNELRAKLAGVYYRIPVRLNPVALRRQIRHGRILRNPPEPLRLHLGCGSQRFPGFVNIDMKFTKATDYVTDIAGCRARTIRARASEHTHVIEHIPHPMVPAILAEWRRVLAPAGVLVLECPELDEAVHKYLAGDLRMLATMYGWQRYPGDTHYYGYNVPRLSRLLTEAGSASVTSEEPIDYHAAEEPCLTVVAAT